MKKLSGLASATTHSRTSARSLVGSQVSFLVEQVGLLQEMKTINALNLQPAVPLASIKLEIRRKSYQPRRVACDAIGRT